MKTHRKSIRNMLIPALAASALTACATPAVNLQPRFEVAARSYRLVSDVTTTYDIPSLHTTERTHLEATTLVTITGVRTVRLVITPVVFRSGTRKSEPPPPQEAVLTLGQDGQVEKVDAAPGSAVPLSGSKDDIGSLLGSTLNRVNAHLGDRWQERTSEGGSRSLRVAALRFVHGLRCAIVDTAAVRPARRERQSPTGTLTLTGVETSAGRASFAIDLGYPVALEATTQGRFTVGGSQQGGSVTISSHTTVVEVPVAIEYRSDPPSATATPSASATATRPSRPGSPPPQSP